MAGDRRKLPDWLPGFVLGLGVAALVGGVLLLKTARTKTEAVPQQVEQAVADGIEGGVERLLEPERVRHQARAGAEGILDAVVGRAAGSAEILHQELPPDHQAELRSGARALRQVHRSGQAALREGVGLADDVGQAGLDLLEGWLAPPPPAREDRQPMEEQP